MAILSDEFYYQPIRIDTINTRVYADLLAKEGDANGRGLLVTLTENGLMKDTTGITLILKWEHTSVGNQGLDNFEVVDPSKGLYKITYPTEMLNRGTVRAFIRIIDSGKLAGTRNIGITVDRGVGDDTAIASSDSFTALAQALIDVNNLESTYAPRLLSAEQQLADNESEIRTTQSNPTNFSGAIITIIDDDARPNFRTVWKPYLDANPDIKIGIAVVKDWTLDGSALSLSELYTLQDAGHDLLCHTTHHVPSYEITPEAAELDYPEAVQWMKDNGLKGYEHLVYPGGLNPSFVNIKNVARKHFKYAISTETAGDYATAPVDNWCVPRMNGDAATLAELQAAVDYAKANGIWLMLMTHSHVLLEAGAQKMADFITYVKSQNVPILPYSEAVKLKGNAVALGEYTSENSLFVDVSGKVKGIPTLSSGTWTPRLEGSTGQGVNTYTKQLGAWTKIGNMVFLTYEISIGSDGIDAAMTGNLKITGLPFPTASLIRSPVNYNIFNLGTNFTNIFASIGFPSSLLNLVKTGNNVAEAYLTSSNIVAGQTLNLIGQLTYKIT